MVNKDEFSKNTYTYQRYIVGKVHCGENPCVLVGRCGERTCACVCVFFCYDTNSENAHSKSKQSKDV